MPLVRLILPFGLIVFGAVAAFMGAVVLMGGLRAGEIGFRSGPADAIVDQRVRKADDPEAYWQALGLAGGLPLVLGLGAVFAGRRLLRN